jgi:F0F1-type ATP synthase membrane subunit c/vacuolar-type H+-ATPase subunit K
LQQRRGFAIPSTLTILAIVVAILLGLLVGLAALVPPISLGNSTSSSTVFSSTTTSSTSQFTTPVVVSSSTITSSSTPTTSSTTESTTTTSTTTTSSTPPPPNGITLYLGNNGSPPGHNVTGTLVSDPSQTGKQASAGMKNRFFVFTGSGFTFSKSASGNDNFTFFLTGVPSGGGQQICLDLAFQIPTGTDAGVACDPVNGDGYYSFLIPSSTAGIVRSTDTVSLAFACVSSPCGTMNWGTIQQGPSTFYSFGVIP